MNVLEWDREYLQFKQIIIRCVTIIRVSLPFFRYKEFRDVKLDYQIWIFIKFPIANRLIDSKRHLKEVNASTLKQTFRAVFHLKNYFRNLNLDFHQFLLSKQLLHPKRYLKENLYVAFERNRLSCFFETLISKSKNLATKCGFPSIFPL